MAELRWLSVSLISLHAAGCLVEVSFENTAFRCAETPACPPGFVCIDDVCRPPPMDAAIDAVELQCPGPDVEADEVTALRAPFAPVIDGALESMWEGARSVGFINDALSDNRVVVRLMWDDDTLYFAFEVSDASLEAVSEPDRIFEDDGSEIYLDMAHDETETTNGDDAHYIANIVDVVQSGTMEVATAAAAGGYVMEHALPWTEVGGQAPAAGSTVGMLLGNNDRDNDVSVQFDWRGLVDSGNYTRPNLWGDLHLADAAVGDCP